MQAVIGSGPVAGERGATEAEEARDAIHSSQSQTYARRRAAAIKHAFTILNSNLRGVRSIVFAGGGLAETKVIF